MFVIFIFFHIIYSTKKQIYIKQRVILIRILSKNPLNIHKLGVINKIMKDFGKYSADQQKYRRLITQIIMINTDKINLIKIYILD